jgi:UDP:flavonoid glycosyltransferase YjiC (YdhE family)
MDRFAIQENEYVLFIPGGGTPHPGAENAPEIVAAAARRIAGRGYPTILVGAAPRDGNAEPTLRVASRLPMEQLCELIRGARMVVSNGGDTLLQVLASRRPCVAVPIAGDQAHRIACCADAGVVVASKLDSEVIERDVIGLLENEHLQARLQRNFDKCDIGNDLELFVDALIALAGGAARFSALR